MIDFDKIHERLKEKAMTNWRTMILDRMTQEFESFDDVISMVWDEQTSVYNSSEFVDSETELDRKFNNDFGRIKGRAFLIHTHKNIYFPAAYDGSEWVECLPRNPVSDYKPSHVGE